MDTIQKSYIAEDNISSILQKNGFLVAKPKFDQQGADLIALINVKDGSKFGRIQCKWRSLENNKQTNIKIPKKYVFGSFFVFLDLAIGKGNVFTFLFFVNDIKKWRTNKTAKIEQYVLNIYKKDFPKQTIPNKLSSFLFKNNKIPLMKSIIKKSTSKMERKLWDIIQKQQKLHKLSTLKHNLDTLNSDKKYIEEHIRLLDENMKLNEEKGATICKELFAKIAPDIISYTKKLNNQKIVKEKAITLTISKYRNKHKKIEELELLVKLIYGEYPSCFKISS